MAQNELMTLNEARRELHDAQAGLNYFLELRGDAIAKENGWKNNKGLEAVKYFLMQKHHWTPGQLNAMSFEHLHFAMSEETAGKLSQKAPRG